MKLGDYLKSINYTKKPMNELDEDYEFVKKKYVPFIINRCLSFYPDSIIQSNNMNLNDHVDKVMQYDYLRHSLRRRNRFNPWMKKTKPDDLKVIKEYFNYSDRKAYEAIDILTDKDIENIKKVMDRGG